MKITDIVAWVILMLTLVWLAYDRQSTYAEEECQAYDRVGNGIGCEGPDIADR